MQVLKLFESQSKVVEKILNELELCRRRNSKVNHSLIFGAAGTGKTTVLESFFEIIEKDKGLKEYYEVITLPMYFDAENIDSSIENILSLKKIGKDKHALLFIDDLHLLVGDSDIEADKLRMSLMRNNPKISLIATTRSNYKGFSSHNNPLYGFFKHIILSDMTSNDVQNFLKPVIKTKIWMRLNEKLALSNPFWLLAIADENPRLLTLIKNIVLSEEQLRKDSKKVFPDKFIKFYYELAGPIFLNELSDLPKKSRYFLEAASVLGKNFAPKEVSVDLANLSQEAIKLYKGHYLDKKTKGKYSFKTNTLKSWFRYVKNLPIGRVLNPDKEVINEIRMRISPF